MGATIFIAGCIVGFLLARWRFVQILHDADRRLDEAKSFLVKANSEYESAVDYWHKIRDERQKNQAAFEGMIAIQDTLASEAVRLEALQAERLADVQDNQHKLEVAGRDSDS